MEKKPESLRIDLTETEKKISQEEKTKELETVDLTTETETLEPRIAPVANFF